MISLDFDFSSLHFGIHSIFRTFLNLQWMTIQIATVPVTQTELSNGIDLIISSAIHYTSFPFLLSLLQGNNVCTIPDPSLRTINTESFITRMELTHPAVVTLRQRSEEVSELQGHDFNGLGQWLGSREMSNTDESPLLGYRKHREIDNFPILPSILTLFALQKSVWLLSWQKSSSFQLSIILG